MDAQADMEAPGEAEPGVPQRPGGWRRWLLRVFVLTLLLAGAGTVAVAAVTIVTAADETKHARKAVFGVLMPADAEYRQVVGGLVARKQARHLGGLTVVGERGAVKLLPPSRAAKTFLSSYLNPNALAVIARSIGLRSDKQITVDELRLEVVAGTGRLRWRVRGRREGRPWRAVVAPNGTDLRLLRTRAS